MIDLQSFCCKPEANRYSLEKPFSRGEWTYATNGHIAVRMPRLLGSEENTAAPAIEKLSWPDAAVTFAPLPKIDVPKAEAWDCRKCEGRGVKHDCPECTCACETCHGTGQQLEQISVGVGPAIFNARYLSMALQLPKIEFGPYHAIEPVPFRFDDGGQGLIMPMRSRLSRHIDVDQAEAA